MNRRTFLATAAGTTLAIGLAGCSSQTTDIDGVDPDRQLSAPALGNGEVTVEVYADFTCPACHRFQSGVFPTIEEELIETDEITYQHADFPIPVEDEAVPMANAARAIQAETKSDDDPAGEFFAYKEELFATDDWGNDNLESTAEDVGVDPDVVADALEDETYLQTLAADKEQGEDAGVEGTPAVIVDGQLLDEPDAETIIAAVEDAS
ncbi:thioredoxin domain-containing protein [Natronorubrum daqingense]|uniref:Disulfide bond formation protein DsbA n=1 Tax=Natronorubrum daqingense TaxID=588898 RepID=A0A1N6YMB8_9EURY|nr:thioredoxin domain-containing protein [Natronorubrum daqingense]APX95622.1 disulfide bond formation protein DsbA [Natronorubrum daqingense]SIR15599.1 Protein-disulfide isomerase [Natronorubrum daqingense]